MYAEATSHQLSLAERGVLTLHELSGRSGGYNLRCALRLSPDGDPALLALATDLLLARHPVLRSEYLVGANGFERRVRADGSAFHAHELRLRDGASLHAWIAERSMRPFDLARELPVRFDLIQAHFAEAPCERVLLITTHHVASDYASIQVLVAELEHVYQALKQGGPPQLGPTAPFEQRVQRESDYLRSERAQRDRRAWADLLRPLPSPLSLPGSETRPVRPRFVGREFRTRIDGAVTANLRELARRLGSTPYLITLSAAAVLLATAACRTDLLIGTTLDSDTDRLRMGGVGYFVNTLPLRLRLLPDESFALLLSETRHAFARSLGLSRLPFPALVEHLGAQRDPSVPALFQVMFTWLRFAPEFVRMPEPGRLLLEVIELSGIQPAGVTHDLVLSLEDRSDYLACVWAFDDALLPLCLVQRLAHAYAPLLHALVTRPDDPLAQVCAECAECLAQTPREQQEL